MGMWIIPARAGFTHTETTRRVPFEDHPRSRGVYLCLGFRVKAEFGSSPLARGLPISTLTDEFFSGIIPARAGFTSF